ncbi:hypothetical protein OIE68_45115 [Nocardia vinacea]|uniref:hypothetical protein n=1 Tax=Nocardia vinacea TaxID=96468 RepID=UPI002E1103C0|nr:hypothetical protein OIE68_45115 [Nocardia vinacea]
MDTAAQVASAIIALVALSVAAVALVLTYRQTRSLAEQTRLANKLARTAELRALLGHLHSVTAVLLEKPELRKCVYGHDSGGGLTVDQKDRLDTMIEMLADVLELLLVSVYRLPSGDETTEDKSWLEYVRDMRSTCPKLCEAVRDHPTWWPALAKFPDR